VVLYDIGLSTIFSRHFAAGLCFAPSYVAPTADFELLVTAIDMKIHANTGYTTLYAKRNKKGGWACRKYTDNFLPMVVTIV
ncbi:hypothetical protein PFISCL1PPCAC_20903, partial [Pristionchus fissidentatus]